MYRNFLEEVILTGYINNNFYFQDLPNGLLIEQNNQYILSIESAPFICKIVVCNVPEVQVKRFTLPINKDSKDLIICWDNDYYTQVFSLHCRQTIQYMQTSQLIKGDCYYNKQQQYYMVFDGNAFIKYNSSILPQNLTQKHQFLIHSQNKKIESIQLVHMDTAIFSHTYLPGTYYIKIRGGLTGFTNLQGNNSFYYAIDTDVPDVPESNDGTNTDTTITTTQDTVELPVIYLAEILAWGNDTNWNTLTNAFNSAKKLKSIPSSQMPNVNDAISCFYNCQQLELPEIKKLLPNALIYSNSMFENCGLHQNISFLEMAEYNTVIDRMFASTNISGLPYNYDKKDYYSGNNIELSASYCFYDTVHLPLPQPEIPVE